MSATQFNVGLKVTADASQYTGELTRAGQTTVVYSQQVQAADTAAQAMGNGLRAAATAAQANQAAGVAMLAALRDQVATTGKSTEELLRYRAAQAGVAAEAAPLILQLQNQRAAQQLAAESARAEEAAQRANAAAKQQSAAAQESFLAGLRDQAALQGKTQAEVMRYRAAQLGVAEGAEQYIRALEQGASANRVGALSAKEHAMAMRMLPMQMTDVVTSMASGMPVWMVAIQQGGQIKDSFGGVGNALRAVLGAITPTVAGIGLLAGAASLGAAAYYQGSREADGYRQAIVMTGNAADTTVGQLTDMARGMSAISGTQGAAAESLTALAGTGAIASENLQQFATVAMDLERRVGQPVKTTAQHLEELGKAPVQASLKLNEQYHYLTEAVYSQIKALQDQGKQEEAASLAQRTYANAMAERTAELRSNLGTLERMWEGLGKAAGWAWDRMLNIGRAATLSDIRAKIDDTNSQLNDLLTGDGFDSTGGGAATGTGGRGRAAQIERLKKQLSDLHGQAAPLEAEEAQAQIRAEKQATDAIELAARQRIDTLKKNVRTQAEIRKQEIDQLDRDRETLKLSTKEYNALLAGINEKYKDKKTAGAGGIKVSDSELANLQGQLEAAKLYGQQLATLGAGASELNAGERESLKIGEELARVTDAKTAARLREKQAIADALGVQLRSNDGLEKSLKASQASVDALYKDADAIRERANAQDAANATYGKSKTAIEEMHLAAMKAQLAEAEGSDRFTASFIQGKRAQIEEQEHWVKSLQAGDYKAAEQHVDELLRGARAMAKAYEDEQQLSGLTALEREKIVAQRQVELKYAKELAAIDKSAHTDAEKQALREETLEAQRIESAAAVAKAQQQYMARASDEINRSLTDALMRGFEAGKGFAENLADTTKNLFNSMVLRPVISAIMTPVSLVINGIVQQGLSAVGLGNGGAGNAMSMLSLGKDLYSAITGGFSTLSGQVASWVQSGMNWMSGSGGMISQGPIQVGGIAQGVGSLAGTAAGVAGGIYGGRLISGGYSAWGNSGNSAVNTGTAAGAAIGSIVPGIGTALGALIGGLLGGTVNRLFGRKLKDAGIEGAVGGDSGFEGRSFEYYKGGLFRSDKTKYSDLDEEVRKALADTYIGMRDGTRAMAGVLGLGTQAIDDFTAEFKVSLKGLTEEEADKRIKEEFDKIAESLASTALGTEEFTRDGETAVQTLTRLSGSLVAVNDVFGHLGVTLLEASLASGGFASGLIDALGGMEKFQSTMQSYFQSYYSDTERLSIGVRDMRKEFGDLGAAMPSSRQELRSMITAALEAGEAGKDLAAGLLDASAGFDAFADALMSLSGITTDSIKGIFTTILEEAGSAEEAQKMGADAFESMIMDGLQNALLTGLSDIVMNAMVAPLMEGLLSGAMASSTVMAAGGATAAVAMASGGATAGAANAQGGAMASNAMASGGASAGQSMASGGAVAGAVVGSAVQYARDYMQSFGAVMKDPEVLAGIKDMKAMFGEISGDLFSSGAFSVGGGGGGSFNGGGGGSSGAASEADKLSDALERLGETMSDEVKRLRGLMVEDSPQSQEVLLARFATSTAAARAGDQEALKLLPELSRAIESATAASAISSVEVARMRGWLAGSLSQTLGTLGLDVPQFAVGTNYVPRDMLALIHEGEAIVPKAFNPTAFGAGAGADSNELRGLRVSFDRFADVSLESALNGQRLLLRVVRALEHWEVNGMPAARKENWSPA